MKRFALLLLCSCLFLCQMASAQQNLSGVHPGSALRHLYKVTPEEARRLYKKSSSPNTLRYERMLHTPAGTFPDSLRFPATTPPGNYLEVYALYNNLTYIYHQVPNVYYKLINNDEDLAVLVHDIQGNSIANATVRLNNKTIPYDAATHTYRLKHYRKHGILEIKHQEVLNMFDLSQATVKHKNINWKRKWYQFKKLFSFRHHRSHRSYSSFAYRTAYEQNYMGFLALSKPLYKPRDTVKLKAFILQRKGKPVDQPLLLRLSDRHLDIDTILATLHPYRPGGYDYQFVLHDSLDLDLDERYQLTLEADNGNEKKKADEEEDEEDKANARKVLIRNTFDYEEYELKSITFNARTDDTKHTRGKPVAIYLRAADENNLPVMDGRVLLCLKRGAPQQFYARHLFVPDTLWQHEVTLEPAGETKVMIPDSIFPALSMQYQIYCRFLNSNNESQTRTLTQQYLYNREEIVFTQKNDSLQIKSMRSGKPYTTSARLLLFNAAADTVSVAAVNLPVTVPLHPYAEEYTAITPEVIDSYSTDRDKDALNCISSRNRDSVFVEISNPHRYTFWYSIYAGKKLVKQGYDKQLSWRAATTTPDNYTVSLQYIRNDELNTQRFPIVYADKRLDITINSPQVIYPGQTTRISVNVTDAAGRPVADADVTAYGLTSKFKDQQEPSLPYLGKIYPGKWPYSSYKEQERNFRNHTRPLDWERWNKPMSLDSNTYYRFLHPNGVFYNTESVHNGLTQLAPFVILDGSPQRIIYLWIDEQPAYFDRADITPAYSFAVNPGYHYLKMRTPDKLITIDSVYAAEGRKTFLSISADHPGKFVHIEQQKVVYTPSEKLTLSRYLVGMNTAREQDFTYINQNGRILPAKMDGSSYSKTWLVWPLTSATAAYTVKEKFIEYFDPEPGYAFTIKQGLIKEKEFSPAYIFNEKLNNYQYQPVLQAAVITEKDIDSMWAAYKENMRLGHTLHNGFGGPCELDVQLDTAIRISDVKQLFLYRYDDPLFSEVYPGSTTEIRRLHPGMYRILVLLKKNRYYVHDSLEVKKGGLNFYRLKAAKILPEDGVSRQLGEEIWRQAANKNWYTGIDNNFGAAFNSTYLGSGSLTTHISGIVVDKAGEPVPGAIVMLSGTKYAATTNPSGHFSLAVTPHGYIHISSVGYSATDVQLDGKDFYRVTLYESSQALEEVVVTGYASQPKRNMTGRVAGVASQSYLTPVRSISATLSEARPLIILDGAPYEGDLSSLDPTLIKDLKEVKGPEMVALYGTRAANGVIFVTSTLKGPQLPEVMPAGSSNKLRRNFRDDAFWQPRLRTNEKGEASFDVTFPDDITNWKTYAIAINGQRQTGITSSQIKAFQALSASLAIPAFAVAGDTLQVIGKILNYTADSTAITRSFYADDRLLLNGTTHVRNSHIDTVALSIPGADSISLKYTISGEDNFFDGEYRAIPIFPQGTEETSGHFIPLHKDTAFTLPFPDTAALHVYASTGLLPVLLDEIDRLKKYEYYCNEQMASKLIGLLMEKRICQYLNKKFKDEKMLRDLIRQLTDNQNSKGLWGWWNKSEPVSWISSHVTKALYMAAAEGYQVNVNTASTIAYHMFQLESKETVDRLSILEDLYLLKAKANFRELAQKLDTAGFSGYNKLRWLYLKLRAGDTVNTTPLLRQQQHSMMGNAYWGEDNRDLFSNSVQYTLLVYKLLRTQGGHDALLEKIRAWLLERRQPGHWRNTYESAAILETILPDLLQTPGQLTATITLNGKSVTTFPLDTVIKGGTPLQITKTGRMPVYFTAWQQHWNPAPEKVSHQFEVSSGIVYNGTPATRLRAGAPVTLNVDVTVAADADYVMVEIPIPAGCSYENKSQQWSNNEVHREHFKNKVSIFCSQLSKGRHHFTVSLMPRYSGSFHLNPAKAEMMYFPVFFGRERMKQIIISGK